MSECVCIRPSLTFPDVRYSVCTPLHFAAEGHTISLLHWRAGRMVAVDRPCSWSAMHRLKKKKGGGLVQWFGSILHADKGDYCLLGSLIRVSFCWFHFTSPWIPRIHTDFGPNYVQGDWFPVVMLQWSQIYAWSCFYLVSLSWFWGTKSYSPWFSAAWSMHWTFIPLVVCYVCKWTGWFFSSQFLTNILIMNL